jgi:hypothetical protein
MIVKTGERKTMSEKRRDIRHSCSKMVEFHAGDRQHLGCIKNESKTGVFIETRGDFRTGQDITLISTDAGLEFKKTGKIVAVYPTGIAVEFNWPGYTR